MIRITIACPADLIPDANQLARVIGYGPADDQTYGEPVWQDTAGNRYAVASGLVTPAFPAAAAAPLIAPEWGADMEAAARAQALIRIGGPAAPGQITAIIGEDVEAALAELAVYNLIAGIEP